jgi:hypothetical protein
VNRFYINRPARPSKSQIIILHPWNADEVIRELADPWIFRLAADALAAVARDFPTLGIYGWDLSPTLISADEPATLERFAIAIAWLRRLERSKTPAVSSYFFKHVLEYESQANSVYMPNGVFIAAAISAAIGQRRGAPNSPNSLLGLRLPPNNWQWKIWPGSRIRALLPEERLLGNTLSQPSARQPR